MSFCPEPSRMRATASGAKYPEAASGSAQSSSLARRVAASFISASTSAGEICGCWLR
jgi:hypothetical protein